jgi:hypothetical protein
MCDQHARESPRVRAHPTGPKKGERNLKPQVAVMTGFETKMSHLRFE